LSVVFALLGSAGCDKMALTAPTQATITLTASSLVLPVNGTIELTATVSEQSGTPVHNGTVVTFSSTVGAVEPREARTEDGKVTVRLSANGQSGTATVTATSGTATATLENILVGGAAASAILLRANPQVVPPGGGTVELVATVVDAAGGPIGGVPVTFSVTTGGGSLSTSSVLSDAAGEARTSLTTNRETTVRASAGPNRTADTTVRVSARPTITLSVSPASPVEDQAVTFTLAVTAPTGGGAVQEVRIDFGDGTRRNLGAFTGSTTLSHTYDRPGTYTVTVTVLDTSGEIVTHTAVVVVTDQGTVPVTVTVTPASPTIFAPVTVSVTATPPTGAGTITRYHYDFGDGNRVTLTGNSTTHAYATAGHKVVTVRVETTTGATGVGRTEILVSDQPPTSIRQ
jgi:hypothetical protein